MSILTENLLDGPLPRCKTRSCREGVWMMNGRIAPSKMTRLLALAALAMWVATAQAGGASASDDAALIRVESGSLRGSVTDGIASYKGIPYAAPPTGDRRWQAPAP